MPNAPKKHERLPAALRERTKQNSEKYRGSRQSRGYDAHWEKIRNVKIKDMPWCEWHLDRGEHVLAKEVDHIVPFKGTQDPLRLDYDNLQSLCTSCHRIKTMRQNA